MIVYLPRLLAALAVLALVPRLAPLAALVLFVVLFTLTHDAMHGALGVSRRWNGVVLTLAGLAIATSGHALRRMHLRHHAHTFAPDDAEGTAARLTSARALLAAPRLTVALQVAAWRSANRRERRWQLGEYAALAALLAVALVGPRLLATYAAVAVAMQAFAPWWAGHLPHRARRLVALARRLAVRGSPVLASLAYHDLHHRRPKLPSWRLRAAATAGEALVANVVVSPIARTRTERSRWDGRPDRPPVALGDSEVMRTSLGCVS